MKPPPQWSLSKPFKVVETPLEVLPPLVVYQAPNVYSDEMRAIFQGHALVEGR